MYQENFKRVIHTSKITHGSIFRDDRLETLVRHTHTSNNPYINTAPSPHVPRLKPTQTLYFKYKEYYIKMYD